MLITKRNFLSRSNLARASSCRQKIPPNSVLNTNPLIFLLLILETWNFVSWGGTWPELFLQTSILHHVKPAGVDRAWLGGQCPPQHPSQDQGSRGSTGAALGSRHLHGDGGRPGPRHQPEGGSGSRLVRGTGLRHSPGSVRPSGVLRALHHILSLYLIP